MQVREPPFRQAEGSEEVLFFIDMISFYDGGEDREAIFGIQRCIKIVAVDACNFLLAQVSGGNPGVEKYLTISSPGLAESIKFHNKMTSRWRGRRPGGTEPGDSCKVIF